MTRMQHRVQILTAAIFFGLVPRKCVLGQDKPVNAFVASTVTSGSVKSEQDPELAERFPRYKIQHQDVLLLNFPLTPEMNQTVTVAPDGYINLQSAGACHAEGLTIPELINALQKAYAGILHDPLISVDLVDFQKPSFTVSGQVAKPGQYELRADLTVAEALAVAGGMTMNTAKTQIFLFRRTPQDRFEVKKIDIKDVLNGKHVNEDAYLRPGDMIYVPEKFIANFRKYVPYSATAGTYFQPTNY
jgi:protein involved in polysaccharide export with SLBB domain